MTYRSFTPIVVRAGVLLLLTIGALLYGWPDPVLAADPSFPERRLFGETPGYARSVAVGDMDGDGRLDIAVVIATGYGMIYLQDDQGNFTRPRLFSLGSDNLPADQLTFVAIGDMDGDGNLDLVTNRGVYLNDGMSNFTMLHAYAGLGADDVTNLAIGDLNGDGYLDVAAGSSQGQSAIYLNDGRGNFTPPCPFGTGTNAVSQIAIGDINADGYLDLVDDHENEPGAVYLNDGAGNFGSAYLFADASVGSAMLAVGDLNGDGHLDIVTGRQAGQSAVYLNDGAGKFTTRPFGPALDQLTTIALGDLDGDGDLDLVVGRAAGQSAVYLNDGTGNLVDAGPFTDGTQPTNSVAISDMNGDGQLDIIAGSDSDQSAVYLNDGAGDYQPSSTFAPGSLDITSSAVGDMNGDGHLDLVLGRKIGQGVVILNDGTGNFTTVRTFNLENAGVPRPEVYVAVGDMNGDQQLDIVMVNQDGQGAVYRNDGAANFTATNPFGAATRSTHEEGRYEASVVIGDLNGDGALDFVIGFWGGQNTVYLNDGAGKFAVAQRFGTGEHNIVGLALGDLNGDGALDLAVAIQVGHSVVYLNDGAGNFTVTRLLGSESAGTAAIAVGDMNGDGYLDVVTGCQGSPNVIYFNDGLGNFTSVGLFGPDYDLADSIALGDLTGDGHLDIVAGSNGQSAVYLNDGAGNFTTARPFGADNTPVLETYWLHRYIAVGDVDGDGKLDLIVAHDLVDPSEVTDNAPLTHLQEQQKIDKTPQNNIYLNPQATQQIKVNQPGHTPVANFQATTEIFSDRLLPITYTVASVDSVPIGRLAVFYSRNGGGQWRPAFASPGTRTSNLVTSPTGVEQRFEWDTYASGFFGQSDAVVLRFVAYPQARQPAQANPFRYPNAVAGPVQYPYVSTVTLPFRVRGMAIRAGNAAAEPITATAVLTLPNQFARVAPGAGETAAADNSQAQGARQSGDQQAAGVDEPSFAQAVRFGNIAHIRSVALGDFNGDGALDIVEGNSWGWLDRSAGDGNSNIYLNDGQGHFPTSGSQVTNHAAVHTVAVGDLNGDGWLDIIVGNEGEVSTIHRNDGQGNFTQTNALGHPATTTSLAVGDLNGDGALDIVQGNNGQASYLYLNDGQGDFSQSIPLGDQMNTQSVALGDLNGDGALDIVQGNNDQVSYLYLNDGQGGFTQSIALGNQMNTQSIALGDFNGDGALDIVQGNAGERVAQGDAGQSLVYLNDGQGGFPQPIPLGNLAATTSVAVGDLNSDGLLDIIQGNNGQASFIYLNDGQGGFTRPIPLGNIAITASMAVGDLNGDGTLDVVQGNFTALLVENGPSYVYLNNGYGAFTQSIPLGSDGTDTRSVAVGDFNRDGALDIVQGNNSQVSYVYLNHGDGAFTQRIALGNQAATTSVAVGDFNGDAALDIVQGNSGQSYLYLNDGQGAFTQMIPLGLVADTLGVVVGDLNGDNALDIIQNNAAQSYIYLNDGQGGFSQPIPLGLGEITWSVALGDLNGDGALDIVQGNYIGLMYLYLNDGRGGFTQSSTLGNHDERTQSVALGDLNGDGALDIVQGSNGLSYIYFNDGQGHFPAARIPLGTIVNAQSVALGDLNGDGALDIVQGNYLEQSYLYLNDGQGAFAQPILLGKGETPPSVALGNPNRHSEALLLNQPKTTARSVALGDFNNDGRLDIVQGNAGQSYLYRNGLRQAAGLVNQGPLLAVTRPGPTGNANFFSTPALLSNPTIPITYTLFDQEGESVGRVEAAYSLDGGGKWLPAVAAQATVTQNLRTGGMIARALSAPSPILANGSAPLQAKLTVTPSLALGDVAIWFTITHPDDADLAITLQSPQGIEVPLVAAGQAQGQNMAGAHFSALAATTILSSTAPYTGTYQPVGDLAAFKGEMSNGVWTLVITNTGTSTGTLLAWGLQLQSLPTRHVFYWDTFASGFFGQSDNVVMRLVAYGQPLSTTLPITGSYSYINSTAGPYQQPYASATTFPFSVRGTQVRVLDSDGRPIANALVYRLAPGSATGAQPLPSAVHPLVTTSNGYLPGRGVLVVGDQLVALLPMTATHLVTFTNQFDYYLSSAAPISTGLAMQKITTPGLITITLPTAPAEAHPLLLFNLTVSLEWDAGADPTFLATLTEDFKRASELLYHATDGQVALGRIDVFPAKTFWNRADMVIYASNSLRPSAAIGGIVNAPLGETVRPALDQPATKAVAVAYLPGQVRMGTTWDPFGEEAGDLSEQWWRALAHELAHHLFFLPDDYLGFKLNNPAQPSGPRSLGRVDCQGSFMTSTFDPNYRKFLNAAQWLGDCRQTLAEQTTGRADWATIAHFYPMLKAPRVRPLAGPDLLPLAVTQVVIWPVATRQSTLAARYFELRGDSGAVIRLPTAHVYLFQTQGTADPTDDGLLALGSPTGGGDRIKVRGAQPGDRLCLVDFGASDGKTYTGCLPQLTAASGSLPVSALDPGQNSARWAPAIAIQALTTRTLVVTVTQVLSINTPLTMQIFPVHYASAPGLSPVAGLTLTKGLYVGQVQLPYPATDVTVRVWVADGSNREAISQFNVQLPWQPSDRVMAGPNSAMLGGPNTAMLGGPNTAMLGGPNTAMLGGPNTAMLGGPNTAMLGGSDYPVIGGTPAYQFTAPALSADSQVIIYNPDGIFEPNGIQSLQILPSPPESRDESWLVPVGQAYAVEPETTMTATRTIAVTYLQRDVPEGYEQNLALYYLPKDGQTWQRLPTFQFVENLVAANLQPAAGIYAIMATVALPELQPGPNLFTYPLPDTRPITTALASLHGLYTDLYEVDANGRRLSAPTMLVFGHIYSINLKGEQPVTLYLAPPRRSPDGSVAESQ